MPSRAARRALRATSRRRNRVGVPAPWADETEAPLVEVPTPGKGGIDDVVDFLGITASRMIKCLVYESDRLRRALLRGDLDVNERSL